MSSEMPQFEWRKTRNKVLDRDRGQCQHCEKSQSEAKSLHVHHKLPKHESGTDNIENLSTLCQSCHYEIHAEERRKGTLEDIRDIFIASEAPVFRTKEIAERFGDFIGSTTSKKLKILVDDGFLKKGDRGVYYRSDLTPESMNLAGNDGLVVDGSYVENGQYIGHESWTIKCEDCDRWIYSRNPERAFRNHRKESCSDSN